MKVLLSAGAERQLEQIGDTIAAENAQRALSFVRELRKRCDGLAQFPLRFPLVRWHRDIGIRRCIHGNYLIFYTVTEAEIIVLHILHGARDYEAIVFPTD